MKRSGSMVGDPRLYTFTCEHAVVWHLQSIACIIISDGPVTKKDSRLTKKDSLIHCLCIHAGFDWQHLPNLVYARDKMH